MHVCVCAGLVARGFFNDGSAMEGGPRLAPVSCFSISKKFSLVKKRGSKNLSASVQSGSCGLNVLQRQLTRVLVLFAFSSFG